MALIKCPECDSQVSDKATVCIHCGFPFTLSPSNASVEPRPPGSVGHCPACNSVNTYDVVAEERKVGGFFRALGARIGTRVGGNGRLRCNDCYHTWEFGQHI